MSQSRPDQNPSSMTVLGRFGQYLALGCIAFTAVVVELGLTYWESYDPNETRFSITNLLVIAIAIPVVLGFGRKFCNFAGRLSRRFSATRFGLILTSGSPRAEKLVSYMIVIGASSLLTAILDAFFSPPAGFAVGIVAFGWWMYLLEVSVRPKI